MLRPLAAALLLIAPAAWAADFATCILDKAPQVANDTAAQAVYQVCLGEHPGGFEAVRQGSGRGLLAYKDGADCTVKLASNTWSNRAAVLIGAACRKLYDEANWEKGVMTAPKAK